jgi:hypothetical protein
MYQEIWFGYQIVYLEDLIKQIQNDLSVGIVTGDNLLDQRYLWYQILGASKGT